MGVHNLWELLAPVGRRVSVETLAGKKLAIDASIWMIQFMKAMRNEKGEMVKNAHILGFFRRICKLLFLRVKPVFVFDGATPALKRRTVAARRRRRDLDQTKVRKTAEKLLLNQIKTMRLQQLAENLKNQTQNNNAKGKRKMTDKADTAAHTLEGKESVSGSYNQEAIDEMLAASLAAEDNESQIHHASTSAAGVPYEEEDDEADEEMILPTMHGKMDPAVLAALPPSMQHDLLVQRREGLMAKYRQMHQTVEKPKTIRLQELTENLKNQRQNNDAKDKRKITDKADTGAHTSEGKKPVSGRYNQEAIDEMLAASLAAEDNESQMHHASTSAAGAPYEEEDDEADEEMVLPTVHGKMDLAVLAALPPSMQLDLLVQMRERLMAENRQKYQKVKKVPERFSELQIQSYLKTVAFRRDIDEVRKSAAGSGIGGVQTSRIASEANREFIFSSSFTGDKQVLASAGLDQNSREQRQMPVAPSSNTSDGSVPTKKSSASGSVEDQSSNMIHNDVETYLDERGRVRVSRVRAMGLRMTRDLQRNLDLMKETEVESLNTAVNTSFADVSEEFPCKMQPLESSDQGDDEIAAHNRSEEFINSSSTPIEVSFDVNGENRDDDDDLFTRLVAGDSDLGFCSEEELLKKQCSNSDSDCEWEEGVILDKSNVHHEVEVGSYPSTVQNRECHDINLEWEEGLLDGQMRASSCLSNYKETDMKADAGNDVEWEDGSSDIPGHTFSCQPIYKEVVSKGDMEEQINFQEAIKRSLEDAGCEKYIDVSSEDKKHIKGQEVDKEVMPSGSNHNVKHWVAPNVSAETVLQTIDSKVFGGAQRLNNVGKLDIPSTNDPPLIQSEPCTDVDSDDVALLVDRAGDNNQNIQPDIGQNCSGMYNAERERVKSVTPTEEKGGHLVETKVLCTSSQIGQVHSGNKGAPGISSHISDSVAPDVYLSIGNAQQFELKNPAVEHVTDAGEFTESFVGKSFNNNTVQSLSKGDNDDVVKDVDNFIENSFMMDSSKEQVEKAKASLEEEMQRLGKERTILGKEHRKLERNAEAVSSEMYTECQELLQMFGLPYIIAPMEAEAQCAFMELENLVDGVVTDDSDVLLFGARSVYKNIFDDRKYVETYFMKDIENELGLTRDKLIRMALLLGSDYTEGVSGVGIVNAIEVINAFPEEDGLHKFREWIESPDPSILGKVDLPARSKLTKTAVKAKDCSKSSLNCSSEGAVSVSDKHGPVDDLHKMKQQFMDKHRKVSKNWHVPSNFPSEAVISEYDSPRVDKSTETFSWGKPDLSVLRKLCWEKFGWGIQKADELLVPVLKEYEKHETQLRMEAFYSFNERFAKIRSKRIEKAVKATMGNKSSELMDDTLQGNLKGKKKRKLSSSQAGSGEDVSISHGLVAGHVSKSKEAATADCSRKKRTLGEPFSPEGRNSESLMQAVERQNTNGGSKLKGRGRSRGISRGISRGRGRGRSGKRGRLKESSTLEYAEISSSDENDNDSPQDGPDEKYDGSHQVRRSTRPRKAVKYATSDLDSDKSANASQDSGSSVDVGGKELLENSGISTAFDACGSKLKHHESDPLLAETSSDNIQLGGEFCQGEAELNIGIDHVNLDQNGYTHSNADEDYLRMGGGFCFEEDDVDNDTGKSAYSPRRNILHDNDNPSNCSVFMEDIESDIRYDASHSVSNSRSVGDIQAGEHTHKPYDMPNQGIPDVTNTVNKSHANVALSTNIVVGADPGARSGRFLSAMPNLRRKRKS